VPAPAPVAAGRRAPALAAAAALALSGCFASQDTPLTNVVVYWQFQRATFVDGVAGAVAYDVDPQHPAVPDGRCPQSGVDRVQVRDGAGTVLVPSVPCVNAGAQGVALLGEPAGPRTLVVLAFRDGVPDPLYAGQAEVDILPGPAIPVDVVARGLPDALAVRLAIGAPPAATCGAADVQRLEATLRDGAGTLVWRNAVACAPGDTPAIELGAVDRDAYLGWFSAVRTSAPPPGDVAASACAVPVDHFAPQTLDVPLAPGPCAPAP